MRWSYRKWRDRKWPQSRDRNEHVRKYVLRMRNRKLRHIRPSGDLWLEVSMTGSMFCTWPAFSRVFYLSSSNMATGCDLGSLDPFGVLLGVRMRNRKLRNAHSDRRLRVIGVFTVNMTSQRCTRCSLPNYLVISSYHWNVRQNILTWRWWMNDKITWRHALNVVSLPYFYVYSIGCR